MHGSCIKLWFVCLAQVESDILACEQFLEARRSSGGFRQLSMHYFTSVSSKQNHTICHH